MVYRLREGAGLKSARLKRRVTTGVLIICLSSLGTATMVAAQPKFDNAWFSNLLAKSHIGTARNGVAIRAGENTSTTSNHSPAKTALPIGPMLNMGNTACATNSTKTPGLANSKLPQLQKLAEYETICGGTVTNTMMIFTSMPASSTEARSMSQSMANTLQEFAHYRIRPLVILEPTTTKGLINFSAYHKGAYDTYMDAYFQNLKTQGISDAVMGIWVPFPEPNIPEWDDTTIEDTAANIAKTAALQKKYFPASKVSVMFDSMSYPSGSHAWKGGKYTSLMPYLRGIPKGLIDSFGYQGFPWTPPKNEGGLSQANLSAGTFLQSGIAIEAARSLGVRDIWINTGSFGRSHSNVQNQEVVASPEIRSQILQSVLTESKKIQSAGFRVSLHLFAEDKAKVAEGNDWSYWSPGQSTISNATPVFKAFAANTRANGFDFWLFDVVH